MRDAIRLLCMYSSVGLNYRCRSLNSVGVSCDCSVVAALAGDFVVVVLEVVVMNVDSVVADGKCADVDSGDLTGNPFKSRMEQKRRNAKEIFFQT